MTRPIVSRGKLTDKRNHTVEKILTSTMDMLKCKSEGCDFQTLNPEMIQDHEQNGPHRSVTCAFCKETMCLSQLTKHLLEEHPEQQGVAGRLSGRLKLSSFGKSQGFWSDMILSQQPLEVEGQVFFINWVDIDDRNKLFWISFAGNKCEARDFQYTLKIKYASEDGFEYIFSATRPCAPVDISHEEMKEMKAGCFLDHSTLSGAKSRTDGKLSYTLAVSKRDSGKGHHTPSRSSRYHEMMERMALHRIMAENDSD